MIHFMGNAELTWWPTQADEAVAAYRAKPHDLAKQFDRIAPTLSVADLPRFYDRAARELLSCRDRKRAATMFAQARAAESAPGAVPVTDDVWLELHREFASWGALSTKSVAEFVKALKMRIEPKAALEALGQIAVLRARAGQAPWPQLPKQVSAFAKAAGVDELTAHRQLLEPLLMTPPVWESAAAMWIAWRPIMVRVCADSPRIRGLLLNLLPEPESMDGWWLEMLDECGATAGLVGAAEPGAEPVGGRAAWLERTIWHPNMNATLRRRSRVSRLLPTQIVDLIAQMAPALRTDGVPVRLDGPDYWTQRVDVRVLEACLANGVPVADLSDDAGLGLDLWLRGRRPQDDLTATAQDPRFAPVLRDWARKGDAAQLWAIPALRAFLSPPQEAATAPHPLDGPRIYSAVHEFGAVSPISSRAVPRLLYSLRMLTTTLRAGTAANTDPGIVWLGETAELAGRIEWVVLRAISPSTPADRRELLTALLEVWGESVLADPAARIFHGTAHFDQGRDVVADEHGVAMRTYYQKENLKPFMALTDGSPGVEPPSLGRVESVVEMPVGWGTADRLRRLVALVREHGGVPRDPAAAAKLAEGTGLSGYAAEMALAGLIGACGYAVPFTTAEERKALGINAKQADAGREELARIRSRQRLDLLLGILPDDPAELWQPGGMVALAERLAANWVAQLGRGAVVPEATLAAAPDLGWPVLPTQHVLAALADPSRSPLLNTDGELREFSRALPALFQGICWAYAALSSDDPVRVGVPDAVRLIQKQVAQLDRLDRGLTRFFAGPACAGIVERIASGMLPAGTCEADPRASVPELVAQVGQELDLGPEAAALYLQVLAMPNPSDKNVRSWNRWNAATHKAAVADLVAKGLVLEEKRPKAGRGIVLPGLWRKSRSVPGSRPIEYWKIELLVGVGLDGDDDWPAVPLPELFATAWTKPR